MNMFFIIVICLLNIVWNWWRGNRMPWDIMGSRLAQGTTSRETAESRARVWKWSRGSVGRQKSIYNFFIASVPPAPPPSLVLLSHKEQLIFKEGVTEIGGEKKGDPNASWWTSWRTTISSAYRTAFVSWCRSRSAKRSCYQTRYSNKRKEEEKMHLRRALHAIFQKTFFHLFLKLLIFSF